MSPDIAKSVVTGASVEIKDSSELGILLPEYIPKPELITPVNNRVFTGFVRIDFEWGEVANADLYEWQVSESTEFNLWETLTLRTAGTTLNVGWEGDDADYAFKVNETLYWRVRAIKGIQSSLWSEMWDFRLRPIDRITLPMPPWIKEVVTEHDELKPVLGEAPDPAKNETIINIEFAERAGAVDGYNWRVSGAGTLSDQTATSCKFTAPTVYQIASELSISAQEAVNRVCNAGAGVTSVVRFVAYNTGGTTNAKVDINIRLSACDEIDIPEKPNIIGATYYEKEE